MIAPGDHMRRIFMQRSRMPPIFKSLTKPVFAWATNAAAPNLSPRIRGCATPHMWVVGIRQFPQKAKERFGCAWPGSGAVRRVEIGLLGVVYEGLASCGGGRLSGAFARYGNGPCRFGRRGHGPQGGGR